jgi:hypothetical protein
VLQRAVEAGKRRVFLCALALRGEYYYALAPEAPPAAVAPIKNIDQAGALSNAYRKETIVRGGRSARPAVAQLRRTVSNLSPPCAMWLFFVNKRRTKINNMRRDVPPSTIPYAVSKELSSKTRPPKTSPENHILTMISKDIWYFERQVRWK